MSKNVHTSYACDICGKEIELCNGGLIEAKVPARFMTEQNEGRYVDPYYYEVEIDLCQECANKGLRIDASGAMGYNNYSIRKEFEDGRNDQTGLDNDFLA